MKDGWAKRLATGNFVPYNKGKKVSDANKIECRYCNRLFTKGNHNRWHGDKCKGKVQ